MKQKDMVIEIERVCAIIAEADRAYDDLARVVGCDPEAPIWTVIGKSNTMLIEQTAKLIGDEGEWLSWYVWENDCGRRGFEAGYDKNMTSIKTAAHLAKLIMTKR